MRFCVSLNYDYMMFFPNPNINVVRIPQKKSFKFLQNKKKNPEKMWEIENNFVFKANMQKSIMIAVFLL